MRRCHKNQGFQGIERDIRIRKFNARFKNNQKPTTHQAPTAQKLSCSSIATCHVQVPLPRAYHYVPVVHVVVLHSHVYADATRVFVWTC